MKYIFNFKKTSEAIVSVLPTGGGGWAGGENAREKELAYNETTQYNMGAAAAPAVYVIRIIILCYIGAMSTEKIKK